MKPLLGYLVPTVAALHSTQFHGEIRRRSSASRSPREPQNFAALGSLDTHRYYFLCSPLWGYLVPTVAALYN